MRLKRLLSLLFFILLCLVNEDTSYADQQILTLEEEWNFYDEQLIVSELDSHIKAIQVRLPVEFEEITGNTSGFGTFIKKVSLPASFQGKTLGIELPFTYSASKMYVNGKFYKEVGKVASNTNLHERDLQTVLVPIQSDASEIEIAIQISSFNHIRGGFSAAPLLGDWEELHRQFIWERYSAIFIVGIIFIAGLLTFIIGFLNRKEHLFLVFGLFALVVSLRGIVAEPFLYHDLPIAMSYEVATRLEYVTTNTCFALYAVFIYILYNKLSSKWVIFPCVAILLFLAVTSIFADIPTFQWMFFSVFPIMLIFVFYNIWVMCKAFYLKLDLAKPLMLGVVFVFIGLVLDFLSGMGVVYLPPLANVMIAANVAIVLYSLGSTYVKQMHTVTNLNTQLDVEVKKRTEQLAYANEELQKLVELDGLTGIYNRHKFNETLTNYFKESKENQAALSLIMMDIDDFKKYNDEYGHVKGDELLIYLASFIQQQVPPHTLFARYGGEEFVLLLPLYEAHEASALGEAIREAIVQKQLQHKSSEFGFVTISLGCAERIQDQMVNEKDLIHIADLRLYKSKENGRNQMTTT